MKLLRLLPFLLLTSCGTYATKDHVTIYSNCSYVEWHGGDKPILKMWGVNNSDPTRVSLDGITKLGTAAGMAFLSHGVTKMLSTK